MATVKKVKKYQNAPSPIKKSSVTKNAVFKESDYTPEQLRIMRSSDFNRYNDSVWHAKERRQPDVSNIKSEDLLKKLKKNNGGKVSKAKVGSTIKRKTASGEYKTKITTDKTGAVTKIKDRRTLKGFLKGAPKGRGVITPAPVISAPEAKDGKWIQKATASIKRRGTEGKCTPITKPGCTGRAKALAKTFKKMAKARKGK